MSDVGLKFSAEVTALKRAFDQQQAELQKLETKLKKVSGVTKQATKEEKALAREAKRLFDATRAPAERHNAELQKMGNLLAKNKISYDTWRRGVAKSKGELDRVGASGQRAFGPAAIAKVGAFAAGFVTVSKAIGLTIRALNEMDQKEREIAQRQREARAGVGILQQLPGGPEKWAERAERSRELFLQVGGRSEAEAARTYFQIASANQEQYAELYSRLTRKTVIAQPDIVAKNVAAIKENLGGDVPTLIAQGIVAGAKSPATTGEIMQAAGRLGVFGKQAGISTPELLAATAKAATGQGEAATGGTVIKRLLEEMSSYKLMTDKELQKKGVTPEMVTRLTTGTLAERIAGLEAMGGLKLEGLKDIRGESRARLAYQQLMEKLPELRGLTREIAAAGPATLEAKMAGTKAVPRIISTGAEERAAGGLEIAETRLGEYASFANSMEKDIQTAALEAGKGRVYRWTLGQGTTLWRKVLGSEAFMERFMAQYGSEQTKKDYAESRGIWAKEDLAKAESRRVRAMLRPFGGDREAFHSRFGGYPEEGYVANRGQVFIPFGGNAPAPPPLIGPGGAVQTPGSAPVQVSDQQQLEALRGIQASIDAGNNRRQPAGAGAAFVEPAG